MSRITEIDRSDWGLFEEYCQRDTSIQRELIDRVVETRIRCEEEVVALMCCCAAAGVPQSDIFGQMVTECQGLQYTFTAWVGFHPQKPIAATSTVFRLT